MFVQIAQALQTNSFIVKLNGTDWMAAALDIIHYVSMFVLVGSIAVVDLRVIGIAGQRQSAIAVGNRFFPWVWGALVFSLLSGFLMFAGLATSYIPDPTFHKKMWVILAAVLFGALVQWKLPVWDKLPAMPVSARLIALASLLLWLAAIVAGVEVPSVSGIG